MRGDEVVYEGEVDSIYDWGSITKTMTARLVEELEIDLDAPITRWVDGPSSVTVRGLATHTSGLPRMPDDFDPADPADPWADYTVDKMLAFVARAEVGDTTREYSNLGYCLLGHIASLVGGAPVEELVTERVLRPAGMERSGYGIPTTQGYDAHGAPAAMWHLAPGMGGVGGVHGPIQDLVRWLFVSRARDSRLGWIVQEPPEPPFTVHNGGTYGSSSFVVWHREDGRGVAVLAATGGEVADETAIAVLKELEHA